MHKIQIAESVLSLITSRDRAASTAGDLLEQAADRGMVWFWWGVFRTVLSLIWRDLTEAPARIAGLTVLGLAADGAVGLLFAALDGIVFFYAAFWSGHPLALNSIGWKVWFLAPTLITSLCIGRILGRWAPRRELAASLAYIAIVPVFNLVWLIVAGGFGFSAVAVEFLSDAVQRTPALAGAVWGRNRARTAPIPDPGR